MATRPTTQDGELEESEPETEEATDITQDRTIEFRIEELIEERVSELEAQIEQLESELEELDNFARISLGERRTQRTEQNLSELSESLTGFAERNFSKINTVESRMNVVAMTLAAVIEALDEEGIDIDLSEVERLQEEHVVEATPEERLESAISGNR